MLWRWMLRQKRRYAKSLICWLRSLMNKLVGYGLLLKPRYWVVAAFHW